MGFFDIFKNTKKTNDNGRLTEHTPRSYISSKYLSNGYLQVEYYDPNSDFKNFYDTTRLIISNQPFMDNCPAYDCAVSWYGHTDCKNLSNDGTLDSPRARAYTRILAEIDITQLLSNPDYQKMVMEKLLDQERVQSYIDRGLQDTPDKPCGNYIGGVRQTNYGYEKFFDPTIGNLAHNSEYMQYTRQRHKQWIEEVRQQSIAERKARIQELKSEIDALEDPEQ